MNPMIESLREELRRKIDAVPELAGCGVLDLALPSLRLTTKQVRQEELKLGESRIGGLPDVPPDFQWPRWTPPPFSHGRDKEETGRSYALGFIAQFDLSDLPSIDESLPRTGWLYFFYDCVAQPWGFDPKDRGCCRVVYAKGPRERLHPSVFPADLEERQTSRPYRVSSEIELTLPMEPESIPFRHPKRDVYVAFFEKIWKEYSKYQRFLGHPLPIQSDDMDEECQRASNGIGDRNDPKAEELKKGASDWRLLLQIDSEIRDWGDAGRIYFWVKRQDLAKLRFDDVWLVLQCY